jgi:hypothetical protein
LRLHLHSSTLHFTNSLALVLEVRMSACSSESMATHRTTRLRAMLRCRAVWVQAGGSGLTMANLYDAQPQGSQRLHDLRFQWADLRFQEVAFDVAPPA